MRFQTSIFALASSLSLSLASPAPEPQSNNQILDAIGEIASYAIAVATEPWAEAYESAAAKNPSLDASVSNFGASLASQWTAGYVADTSAIAAFPTEAQVYLKSIIPAQLSILTKNGYVITNTRGATPGPTPPAGGAQPSVTSKGEAVPTMAVKAGAGMAVGFVAAVLAL